MAYSFSKSTCDCFSGDLEKNIFMHRGLATTKHYSIGIDQKTADGVTILIATPEKALCDMIAYTPLLRPRFVGSMKVFLEEDIRLDMDAFYRFDPDIIRSCSEVGKKKNELKNLLKILAK